jgi:hypothetical protein
LDRGRLGIIDAGHAQPRQRGSEEDEADDEHRDRGDGRAQYHPWHDPILPVAL